MKTEILSSPVAKEVDSTIKESHGEIHEKGVEKPEYIRTEAQIIRTGKLARLIIFGFVIAILVLSMVGTIIVLVTTAVLGIAFFLFFRVDIDYVNRWELQKEENKRSERHP